ncbi:MAG: alpha-glucan family phosphorylase, partial [Acidobacteria bacterium]|nr:alpha-glucan family phosphorylase [Acidobacteriota bacterium]
MKPVLSFDVVPSLPEPLKRLRDLAFNLRWAWSHDTVELFRRLDRDLWESVNHNPVLLLGSIDQKTLERAATDDAFLAHLERADRGLSAYLASDSNWFRRNYGHAEPPLVAYFSAEFGVTESLSIFAGGLGVLAGDHLKSASDLGVPLVGVGLLYQQGYFRQYLNAAGWQQERYDDNDFQNLPVQLERRPDGTPVTVTVNIGDHPVCARIWRARVGRISLFLLDTNAPENSRHEDRDITDQLYGGDGELRIRQEILLGIGGYRALEAMGLEPTVCHMNEGHSAFLSLERVRRLMEKRKLSFEAARELASASLVFTTHTPVEAGHDYFPRDLVARYLGEYVKTLGLSVDEFMARGRRNPQDPNESFCMTVLALRLAAFSNGVSKLHGEVSRKMWQGIWPGVPLDEIPVGDVTNGVHFCSWISHDMRELYDRYLGPNWREEPCARDLWRRVDSIPAEELWRTHERRRERLVAYARRKLHEQLVRRGAPQAELDGADEALNPEALTIGFARRFATYKRATLLLSDETRLARILNHPQRPVQIIFAGKAHPRDDAGKDLIRRIVELARKPEFRQRIVFLEDYDMSVSRYLVQGADVWLNTPLRPMEASGTSGMKALANGVLNLSILDGWWDEAWRRMEPGSEPVGWAIGHGEDYQDRGYQDYVEGQALYDLLDSDVIPTFYDRKANGLPRRWVARVKSSIGTLCHFFNTHRMVQEYTERFYLVAHANFQQLQENDGRRAQELAAWKARVRESWPRIRVGAIQPRLPGVICVDTPVTVRARLQLAGLTEEDVNVELYLGRLNADGEIVGAVPTGMRMVERTSEGDHVFEAT